VLFIALIVMVALSIAGIALVRSVDTGMSITGNLGFRQASISPTTWAVENAIAAMFEKKDIADLEKKNLNQNYYAYRFEVKDNTKPEDKYGVPYDLQGTGNTPANYPGTFVKTTDAAGNTIRYVIERMCLDEGPATAANCDMSPPKKSEATTAMELIKPELIRVRSTASPSASTAPTTPRPTRRRCCADAVDAGSNHEKPTSPLRRPRLVGHPGLAGRVRPDHAARLGRRHAARRRADQRQHPGEAEHRLHARRLDVDAARLPARLRRRRLAHQRRDDLLPRGDRPHRLRQRRHRVDPAVRLRRVGHADRRGQPVADELRQQQLRAAGGHDVGRSTRCSTTRS
jgi:hypothetical protein